MYSSNQFGEVFFFIYKNIAKSALFYLHDVIYQEPQRGKKCLNYTTRTASLHKHTSLRIHDQISFFSLFFPPYFCIKL